MTLNSGQLTALVAAKHHAKAIPGPVSFHIIYSLVK
jgi:hypothetical protein